ncbi:MAG: OmpA family protein [Porticoccaceae bacterium]|nr:OmpA family protein [Porticoccaceae bacterium]MDG1311399.1 OmpA family protein [Porticoccaceae bacterium]
MNKISSVIGALAILASGAAASDNWYLGETVSHYVLDNERAIEGDIEGTQAGLQIGKYFAENVAVELGYSTNVGHDDFNVISLTSVIWLGDEAANWRPYAMLGLNQYDFDDTRNLAPGHDNSSNQVLFGVGVGKMIADEVQFRADLRGMGGHDESGEDLGFQLSINHMFGQKSAPAPAAASAPARAPVAMMEEEPEVRTITIRLNVEFEFNKDTVLAVYGDQLEAIAAAMSVHEDIGFALEGHTDSRGSDDYNADLSSRRAAAVKQKLSADYGIAADRISSMGYGESRPIASNETDQGRARNRRVVGEMSFSEVAPD